MCSELFDLTCHDYIKEASHSIGGDPDLYPLIEGVASRILAELDSMPISEAYYESYWGHKKHELLVMKLGEYGEHMVSAWLRYRLEPYFYLLPEVRGVHALTCRSFRIDYIAKPRQELIEMQWHGNHLSFDDVYFGIEVKSPVKSHYYNACAQCNDYLNSHWGRQKIVLAAIFVFPWSSCFPDFRGVFKNDFSPALGLLHRFRIGDIKIWEQLIRTPDGDREFIPEIRFDFQHRYFSTTAGRHKGFSLFRKAGSER